ncbi:MAG: hypothetical protein RL266_195 [Bacteroidota bacterium]
MQLLILALAIGLVGAIVLYLHRNEHVEVQPIILGHGGMGVRSTYPLNSSESVDKALSYSIQGIELDVRMTADGVLVAFHDSTLDRATDCSGGISALNALEVLNCRTGTWLKSSPIMSVEELLSDSELNALIVSLDIKLSNNSIPKVGQMAEALKSLTTKFPNINFLIESKNIELLHTLQDKSVGADLLLGSVDAQQAIDSALINNLSGIAIRMNAISEEEISRAQEQNLYVMLWGCGSVFSNRKAIQMHPDMIQTDDISSMMRILN